MVVLIMYSLGFMLLGVEYTLAQTYHVTLVSPATGDPITSDIVNYLQQDSFNEVSENIVTANFTTNSTFFDRVETFTTGAAFVAWELITLMTGTYIFYILFLMGVPLWMVTAFISIYILLLARAILGYVRGI